MMLLGAATPAALDWAVGLVTPAVVLGLWLTGKLTLTRDCERRLAEMRDAHAAERDAVAATARALQKRIDALVADRDAWRAAHQEEAQARAAAERAGAKLMESTNLSVQLLDALQQSMRGKGQE